MAKRGADAKRRKLEPKKQDALNLKKSNSMEREAGLKQRIKEAKAAAQFYKLKSENIKEEIEELEQKEEDLCNRIRKADVDADAYRSEAEILESGFKAILDFEYWRLRMFAQAADQAAFEFPPAEEIILCDNSSDDDDTGYPTYHDASYYGCAGDHEGDYYCDHAYKLPQNDISSPNSFGSSNSPIVPPSSRRLRSLLCITDAMQELPTDEGCITVAGGGKRSRKLQAKEHLSSVEIEAKLKQELEEAGREAGFYKDKCDFMRYELDECQQREKDLLEKLSEANVRAEQYQREADVLGAHFREEYRRELQGIVLVAGFESDPEEILCWSAGTGYPTCKVCRSCGDEEACMVVLPCNCLSLCMTCETETDTCPTCGSMKTGCFWIDMAN